ncbi:hypothetical protein ACJIZ3_007095 [Penstemon smallii]|uniref:Uncharacterized protein n=1 Tax=Penstemon smallii TaxID=265156 RepID=A0ABD3S9K9_9LAMI
MRCLIAILKAQKHHRLIMKHNTISISTIVYVQEIFQFMTVELLPAGLNEFQDFFRKHMHMRGVC